MSKKSNYKDKVESLLNESNNIAIIPAKYDGGDAFCAGVAIFHMLKEKDKNVSVVYPGKLPKDTEGLIKDEYLNKKLGERNLLVSIDYSKTSASNVHYSTEDGVLHLKIGPVPADFDNNSNITSSVSGFNFDLVISIGAPAVEDLGSSYEKLDTTSKVSRILNIDNSSTNERYGFVNIVDQNATSLSLMVLQKASEWGMTPNDRAAKSLLKGIVLKEPNHRDL